MRLTPSWNGLLHYNIIPLYLKNNLLSSINILMLLLLSYASQLTTPRESFKALFASNREAYTSHHSKCHACCFFFWSRNSTLNFSKLSVPNTLRKWYADSFHFEESQKGSVVFSLVAEWIVHWTVRGHFFNLRCSVDPSPVGGSPFLTL